MFTYGFVDSLEACVATGQKLTIHSHVVHARETLYSGKEKNNITAIPHEASSILCVPTLYRGLRISLTQTNLFPF